MRRHTQDGSIAVVMLLLLLVMVATVAALMQVVTLVHGSAAREQASAQALCLAESGIQVAAHHLAGDGRYAGESGSVPGAGRFTVSVRGRAPLEIVATGEAPCGHRMARRCTVRVRGALSGGRLQVQQWEELP